MTAMHRYLAGVLSVIAVGVVTIAYALVVPATTPGVAAPAVSAASASAAPVLEREVVSMPMSYTTTEPMVVRTVPSAAVVRTVEAAPAPRRVVRQRVSREADEWDVHRERPRDWKKTAMIIGGTTAASAGLGGIFGGKKGALIGAAIGGGASTIYETTRR